MNNIDKRLLAYKPISITLGFDWENTTLDQRAQMRWDYIQEQKKLDPNYVGYDFPEHFSSTHGGRVKKIVYDVAFDLLVNTIGQVISARKEDLLISFGGVTAHGYRVASFYHGNKLAPRRVHRLLGCTFLPVPEELKEDRYKLTINHKNDISWSNCLSNLEWTTLRENTIKAVETGKIKSGSLKFTITHPGPLLGKEYYFFSKQDLVKQKFSPAPAWKSVRTGCEYLCGIWTEISKEEVMNKPIGVPVDERGLIFDKNNGRRDANACVGTIVTDGPCKGDKFAIFSTAMLVSYGFDTSAVYAAIKGKLKVSGACTWERMTREEAKDLPIGLTPEQLDHINQTRAKKTK